MLVLLLVLNHIMNWARAVTLGQEAARAILPTTTDADFQREGNPKRSLVIIERTLLKWSNIYLEHMPMEVKACFYFCKLHLLVPDLNGLAQFAAYAPAGTGVASRLQYIEQTRYAALGDIREASSLSWLILENVPESADMSALWLPVILHFAGLVIWIDMKAQGQLGVRAPLLRLFEQKLRAMRWPCCATMADNLLSLSVAANV
jgi:hypothetical protein